MPTIAEILAPGRNAVSFGAGALMTFGLITASQQTDLITSFDHIFNGIKEISIGLGPVVALGMGWWAKRTASPASQIAAVSANTSVTAITVTDPALAAAAKSADPNTNVTVKS